MNLCQFKCILIGLTLLTNAYPAVAGPVSNLTREAIEQVVERAAKHSGREALEATAKKAGGETLERLAKTFGDDAVRLADDAGLEILEAVEKHGDEVAKIALQVTPPARRAFAMNADELLPLVKRYGPDVLELEAKSPGMAGKAFELFGEGAGREIAQRVPAQEIPRLVMYAEKAGDGQTRLLLFDTFKKEGQVLFERIPPKLVLAGGLTTAMLLGTQRVTQPAADLGAAIRENSDLAKQTSHDAVVGMTKVSNMFVTLVCFVLPLILLLIIFWRFGLMPWQRPKPIMDVAPKSENPITQPSVPPDAF